VQFFKAPPKDPIGVLTAATIKTSLDIIKLLKVNKFGFKYFVLNF
jgi:hypothetical protein